MFCRSCGEKQMIGAKHCPNCGDALPPPRSVEPRPAENEDLTTRVAPKHATRPPVLPVQQQAAPKYSNKEHITFAVMGGAFAILFGAVIFLLITRPSSNDATHPDRAEVRQDATTEPTPSPAKLIPTPQPKPIQDANIYSPIVPLEVNTNVKRAATYNANMTREEYNKNKETYATEAKNAGRTIGSGVNDGLLWTKVRGALLTASDLHDSTINVDVNNGVVTLRGTVANGYQKIRAVVIAKKVDGVKSITNKLIISTNGSNN